MIVRFASLKDLHSINNIAKRSISSSNYYSELAKREEINKFSIDVLTQVISDNNYLILVCEEDKQIVGFCKGYFDCGTFWISWICVDENIKRKGVASKLLLELENILKKKNIHKIWFDTRINNHESNKLAEKLDYKKIVLLKNHWYGLDYFIWEKII